MFIAEPYAETCAGAAAKKKTMRAEGTQSRVSRVTLRFQTSI